MALDKLTKLTSQSGITTTIDYQMSDLTVDTITVQSGGLKMPVGMSTFQNVTVTGDLTVNGTTTTLDTDLIGVDKLEVSGSNTTAVGIITQAGSGDILRLYDNTTQAVTVQDGGRVLIGTTTEGHGNADDLTIATAAGSLGNTGITIRSSTTGDGNIFFSDATSGAGETKGVIKYAHDGNSLRFNTDGSERLRITSGGPIGVGNTNPQVQYFNNLVVGNNVSGDKGITIRTNSDSSGILAFSDTDIGDANRYDGYIRYSHVTQHMAFYTAGANERVRITSAGKVGIGTAVPSATSILHLRTSTNHNLEFEESAGNLRISALNDARDTNEVLQFAASKFNFLTGKVGIEVTNPSYNLDVSGITRITNNADNTATNMGNSGALSLHNLQDAKGSFIDFIAESANGTAGMMAKIGGWNTHAGSGYSGQLTFSTRNGSNMVERLRISSTGLVGVGTVTNWSPYKLQVAGGLGIAESANTGQQAMSITNNSIQTLAIGVAYNALLLNKDGGNVGIKEATPEAKLEVDGIVRILDNDDAAPSTGKGLEITYDASDDQADILCYDRGGGAYKKLQLRGSSIELKRHNTTLINIGTGGSNGTVGFSTTNALVTNSERIAVRGYSSFKSTAPAYAALYVGSEGSTTDTANALILFNSGAANRGGIGYVPNTGELRFNNQYFFTFCTGSAQLGGDERLRIKSDGKVGINSTAPNKLLDVHSTNTNTYSSADSNTPSAGSVIQLTNKSGTDGSGSGYYSGLQFSIASGATSSGWFTFHRTGDNKGDFTFTARNAGSSYPELMRIKSTGEILIGRTSKANDINKLVVTGTSPADSYDSQCFLEGSETSGAANTGGALAFGGHDGSQYRNWANIYGMKENGSGGNTASYMAFHTRVAGGSPAEKVRISSGGKVSIGDAATHTFSAHSEGDDLVIGGAGWRGMTIYGEGGGGVIQFADNGDNRRGQIMYNHGDDSMDFRVNGNATKLRIASGGNVKIGHNNTSGSAGGEDKLNIKGDGAQYIYIGSNDASAAGIYFDGDSNGDMSGSDYARINHNTDGYMQYDNWKSGCGHRFSQGGNTKLQIQPDGELQTFNRADQKWGLSISNEYGVWGSNTGLAPNTTRTWTITSSSYGWGRFSIGGGDGNYQRAACIIDYGGVMWGTAKSYYHNEILKSSSGASISTTYNNGSIVISVTAGSNWWYYTVNLTQGRRDSSSWATITQS